MSRARPRIVWFGVDSLELSSRAPLEPRQVDRVQALRSAALRRRSAEVNLAGEVFGVAPRRGRNAALLLRGENMTIALRPDARGSRPRLVADLRAAFLATVGPDAAVAIARGVVDSLAVPSVVPRQLLVSRVDLAADVQGWTLRPSDLGRFTTKARRIRDYDGPRGFTGFTFGRKARLARVYDKTAEIARRGKPWVREVWSQSERYRADSPVWRVEFQLRREALRSRSRRGRAPLDTWEDVRATIGTLWRELTSDWLSVRLKRTGGTRRRYAPVWRPIMDEPFQDALWAGAHEPLRPSVSRTEARSNDPALDREIVRAVAFRRWSGDDRTLPDVARAVAEDAFTRFIGGGRRTRAAVSRLVARFRSGAGTAASATAKEGGTRGELRGEHGWRGIEGERVADRGGSGDVPPASEPGRVVSGGEPRSGPSAPDGATAPVPADGAGCAPPASGVAPSAPSAVGSHPACVVGGGP